MNHPTWHPESGRFALLGIVAGGVVSCALAVSFDDYGVTGHKAPLFRVRGTVAGLGEARASLLLNGTSLEVADGLFAFPPILADGVDFEVTVQSPQTHACGIEHNRGTIAGADATGVLVTCVARDATLKALSISSGELSPTFDAGTLSYTAPARLKSILAGVPTTLTVTATPAILGARVAIGDITLEAGKPSAPLEVKEGPNVLDIGVTAPSGASLHYKVVVDGAAFDYLKPSDPPQLAAFGGDVAVSGTTLAVASPGKGVYVFTRSGTAWSQQKFFELPNASTALDGDTLVTAGNNPNSIMVYARTGTVWSRQALEIDGSVEPSMFGPYAVAVSGDALAIGYYGTATMMYPSVRIYRRTGAAWTAEGAFAPTGPPRPSPMPPPLRLALSGDTLVVGDASDASTATGIDCNANTANAPLSGATYVLGRSGTTWSLRACLKASNARAMANFGAAVAVSGDTLVVGSPQESSSAVGVGGDQNDTSTSGAGAAYVFTRRSDGFWSEAAYLKGSSLARGFGASVALFTDTVAVGAPSGSVGQEAAYLFNRAPAVWIEGPRVTPPVPYRMDYGSSVALGSGILAVGAPSEPSKATGINGDWRDQSLPGTGAVFVY